MAFEKLASRRNAKLRLAIEGTAGAGKTRGALTIAKEFGTKIGLLDSERGSSQKYAGEPWAPAFFVEDLEDKTIQEYTAKLHEAAEAGIDCLIIDSYSHSWIAALETVDKMSAGSSKFSSGWKVVSPLVSKLVDAILNYPGHVIATMRSKADYVVEKDEKTGKQVPRKVGMAAVAREGTDYEFDVVLDVTVEGGLTVAKSRCAALVGQIYTREDVPKIAKQLKAWLSEGAPISARDAFADRIRFARSEEELKALIPELAKLDAADREALKPVYQARKAEFAG